jgi:hypothetical protein
MLARLIIAGDLENATLLSAALAEDGEAWLCSVASQDSLASVFADGRTVFEAVPRASAHQPDIFKIRMPVDQEIAVGGIFILADAGFR